MEITNELAGCVKNRDTLPVHKIFPNVPADGSGPCKQAVKECNAFFRDRPQVGYWASHSALATTMVYLLKY